jgi:hypothetical protein
VLVTAVGTGIAFAASRCRTGPHPGRLVYASKNGVFAHDLSTGEESKLAGLPGGVELAIVSPDGKWVGYAEGLGSVSIASLTEERSFEVAARSSLPVGWTPDGRLVVGEIVGDRDLVAIDPEGASSTLLSGGYATGAYPVWIDESSFAIASSEDSFVVAVDGKIDLRDDGVPLAVSPDGAHLLVARNDELVTLDLGNDLDELDVLYDGKVSYASANHSGLLAIATPSDVRVFEAGTRTRKVVDGRVDHLGWALIGNVLLYAQDGVAYALELPDGKPKVVSDRANELLRLLSFQVVS